MSKILITANTTWNIFNYRLKLIQNLISLGHSIVIVAPYDEYVQKLQLLECKHIHLKIKSTGIGVDNISLAYRYFKIIQYEKPSIIFSFTIKPNIFGSVAARFLGVPIVNNISGLGKAYINGGWLRLLTGLCYRYALSKSLRVFFQNSDDMNIFVKNKYVHESASELIPGSGVDLKKFSYVSVESEFATNFLMPARLLKEKGVYEYIEAIRAIKNKKLTANFYLLGEVVSGNSSGVTICEVNEWEREGLIKYLGFSSDIRNQLLHSDCVVLPSHREGMSKVLLESAAMGRPIITTDTPGCRDIVINGVNGYLCKVGDSLDLENQIIKIMKLKLDNRKRMGLLSRERMVRLFDEEIVIKKYIEAVNLVEQF